MNADSPDLVRLGETGIARRPSSAAVFGSEHAVGVAADGETIGVGTVEGDIVEGAFGGRIR